MFSIAYNALICLFPLIAFVPMFASFSPGWDNAYYNIFVFIIAVIYIFDFLIRMLILKIFYKETKYLSALKRQLLSVWSNYQLISSVLAIILLLTYGDFRDSGIVLISAEPIEAIITILLFANFASSYFRIMSAITNHESISILRNIILSYLKSIIISVFSVFIIVLLFAFIMVSFESSYPDQSVVKIKNMQEGMYYAFIVMTTVGFGDFIPFSAGARIFTIILALLGIFLYAYIGSIFINVTSEFVNSKKNLKANSRAEKLKIMETKNLMNSIDHLIIRNLYDAGVITKKKYEDIIEDRNKLEVPADYIFDEKDFDFDYKNRKMIYMTTELGSYVRDQHEIDQAEELNWFADKKNAGTNYNTVLYLLPYELVGDIVDGKDNFPVIFSSKIIDKSISKIIIFQKKPYKAAVCEANLLAVIILDKEEAWRIFGRLTRLTKKRFDALFVRQKQISIILIKNIIVYSKNKLLEAYGIDTDNKLAEVIYLS